MTAGLLKPGVILSVMPLLASCSHTPPNIEACIRLHRGAACTHTIKGSGRDRLLTEQQWQAIRLGRISMTPEAWARVRIFIENVCARKGACNDDWQDKLSAISQNIR